jgi:hypothetical protein
VGPPVLDIGPTALRDGRHMQGVALSYEFDLGVSGAIECPLTAELRPKLSAAVSGPEPPARPK